MNSADEGVTKLPRPGAARGGGKRCVMCEGVYKTLVVNEGLMKGGGVEKLTVCRRIKVV
jgi:hypothetical protein